MIDLFIYHIPVVFFQYFILIAPFRGAKFIVWQNGNIDFLFVVDWKLTVLSFFLHGSFVLEYTDSSNQRYIFLRGSGFTRSTNMSNQISRIHVTAKNLCNKSKPFFFHALLFFPRVCFLSTKIKSYNGIVSEAILRPLGGEGSILDGKCDS